MEASCDDDSAGAVDRKLGSEHLVPPANQDGATRPEGGVRPAIRKQAVDGDCTVPELPIAIEVAGRSARDELEGGGPSGRIQYRFALARLLP